MEQEPLRWATKIDCIVSYDPQGPFYTFQRLWGKCTNSMKCVPVYVNNEDQNWLNSSRNNEMCLILHATNKIAHVTSKCHLPFLYT